jgi:folate-dependent phosphoribosylglycinamide formyltransferase PurN
VKGQLLFDPSSSPMVYACGVSGSGTNYERIYERDPGKRHIVFSNAPDCAGIEKARNNRAPVVSLDSARYFSEMWGVEKAPRYGVERNSYDRAMMTLVEQTLHRRADLICLAGYDLWIGDWMAERYFPRILNVHPGDARKYVGLGWRPSAKAILAGETSVRSTVFLVDASDDGGPILIQSASVPLSRWDRELLDVRIWAEKKGITTLERFRTATETEGRKDLFQTLNVVSHSVQSALRDEGDWNIYPFAVHDLIGKGRVALDGRTVYIDGVEMPQEGWQVDKYGFADNIG